MRLQSSVSGTAIQGVVRVDRSLSQGKPGSRTWNDVYILGYRDLALKRLAVALGVEQEGHIIKSL